MPTYEYLCEACGFKRDVFQRITEKPLKRCSKCRRLKLRRLFSGGAGIIFKGSGFYQTDYRSTNYQKQMKEEKGTADGNKKNKSDQKDSVVKTGGGNDGKQSSAKSSDKD